MVTATSKIAALFLLFACPLFSEWSSSTIVTSSKEYDSLLLHYKDPSPFNTTTVDLIFTPSGTRCILNTRLPIQPNNNNFTGRFLSGGEKFLLDEGVAEQIIEQLKNGVAVELPYCTLQPETFLAAWSGIEDYLPFR